MWRIVVFTGGLSYSVRKGIADILISFPEIEMLVVHEENYARFAKKLRVQYRHLKKNHFRWIGYQIGKIPERWRINKNKQLLSQSNLPGNCYTFESIFSRSNVSYLKVVDIHSPAAIDRVKTFDPDIGVALAAPILQPQLFQIPKHGTINLHKGKLPQYRGMPPAFWELWNGEKEIGCTIHMVSEKLDQGAILLSRTIPVFRFSTPGGLRVRLDEVGSQMTVDAIYAIMTDRARLQPQEGQGRTYTQPTLKQEALLRKRLENTRDYSLLRHYAKEFFFGLYLFPYKTLFRKWANLRNNQHISVLLYHRVNDEMRDSMTVGVEQFDKQMEMIRQRYTVVSIEDVILGKVDRSVPRPIVAVTFDDGYADNYENAVPILLKHRIPAAFFVTTGLIDSNRGFDHDKKKLGYALKNMTWKNLSLMKGYGFVIGAHTVTHINCAKADKQTVKEEIRESLQTLKRKLAINDVIFAYPFGKKEDITEDIRQFVKECGFIGCLSAYGGVNKTIDPYNIKRIGVDAQFTLRALQAHIEGF